MQQPSVPWICSIVLLASLAGCAGGMPPEPAMSQAETFTPCPSAPPCVSSRADTDDAHYIEPLTYATDGRTARNQLIALLREMSGIEVQQTGDRFIHATASTWLGSTDDLYFLFRSSEQVIDVKSADREGYYDFGVTRRRVARIRAALDERLAGR